MNIRRGFNRLSIALYAVYLVIVLIAGLTEAYDKRDYYSRRLREHESAQAFDPIAEFRKRWPKEAAHWDDAGLLKNLSEPQKFREAFPEFAQLDDETIEWNMPKYLTPREVAEYRNWRDYPFLTFLGNAFSSKGEWRGLVLAIPGGLYLSVLGLAYGSRWVYRGFKSSSLPSSETEPKPPAQETTTTVPEELAKYKGVKGWLLLFCVSLVFIQPLWAAMHLWVGWSFWELLRDGSPGFSFIMIVDSVASALLVLFGIWTGVALLKTRPQAVRLAKKFLLWGFGYSVFASLLLIEISKVESFKQFVGSAGYLALWYTYLQKSKRVRATYSG